MAASMEFDFDPKLVEEAALSFIRAREERGDTSFAEEYHTLADPIYEEPFEAREPLFRKLFSPLFTKFGLMAPIIRAFNEFSHLEDRISRVFFRKSLSDEGADIVRAGPEDSGGSEKAIVIKVAPGRAADPMAHNKFLNHELMHICDLLDDAFGFSESLASSSVALEPHIYERYRIIWDIHIDSRLIRGNKETISSKEARIKEFSSFYSKFPPNIGLCIFEALWAAEKLSHQEILAMAQDPRELLTKCGVAPDENSLAEIAKNPLPGSRCPLCNFPTYIWAQGFSGQTVAAIKTDFPDWSPERGLCTRCSELYQMPAAKA